MTLVNSESEGTPRVVLTNARTARFEELCQVALGLSAAQFMAFYHGSGVSESDQ